METVSDDSKVGCFFQENLKDMAKDYQVLKVQEKLDAFSLGVVIPKYIMVIVDDDLVDICKPGDDVTI